MCHDHLNWTVDEWRNVSWSDKSSFNLFLTNSRLYVGRTPPPRVAYELKCIFPTAQHGGGSVILWVAISWYSSGLIITLNGRIAANKYLHIRDVSVLTMATIWLPENAILQDGNAHIQTAKT